MNREWVRAVAAEAGGLPSVSGDDNGKVLTVVSGEWEAATASGGGIPAPASSSDGDVLTYSSADDEWVAAAPSGVEKFVITYEFGEGNALVANKTYAQILAAYTAGKEISAVLFDTNYEYLYLSDVIPGETDGRFVFNGLPRMALNDPDTPTALDVTQESITHGITSSVESITEDYINVTIPLS